MIAEDIARCGAANTPTNRESIRMNYASLIVKSRDEARKARSDYTESCGTHFPQKVTMR
jgi:hypothetical protein